MVQSCLEICCWFWSLHQDPRTFRSALGADLFCNLFVHYWSHAPSCRKHWRFHTDGYLRLVAVDPPGCSCTSATPLPGCTTSSSSPEPGGAVRRYQLVLPNPIALPHSIARSFGITEKHVLAWQILGDFWQPVQSRHIIQINVTIRFASSIVAGSK